MTEKPKTVRVRIAVCVAAEDLQETAWRARGRLSAGCDAADVLRSLHALAHNTTLDIERLLRQAPRSEPST